MACFIWRVAIVARLGRLARLARPEPSDLRLETRDSQDSRDWQNLQNSQNTRRLFAGPKLGRQSRRASWRNGFLKSGSRFVARANRADCCSSSSSGSNRANSAIRVQPTRVRASFALFCALLRSFALVCTRLLVRLPARRFPSDLGDSFAFRDFRFLFGVFLLRLLLALVVWFVFRVAFPFAL